MALVGVLASAVPLSLSAQEQPAIAARVTGVVFDSVGMRPLADARVRLVPVRDPAAARVIATDSGGRFQVAEVREGIWLATALHPALDSLGVEPPVVRLEIRESGEVAIALATPSPRTLVAGRCGALEPELGLLFGVVRSARDESPVAEAHVALEWPEWVLPAKGRGLRSEVVRRAVRADSLGRYAVCGVPADGAVRLLAWRGADSTGAVRVEIPPGGLRRRDVSIAAAITAAATTPAATNAAPPRVGAPATRANPAASAAVAPDDSTPRRGGATVRGRAHDINGRPIAGAFARVLGSGDAARSTDDGTFEVRNAMAGSQTVEVRAIGFEPARQDVELRDQATLEVTMTLAPQRVQLDTVRVSADRVVNPALAGFERRWRSGVGGAFLDGATIRDRSTVFVTDALRTVNGVIVQDVGGYGQRILMRDGQGRLCRAQVVVDGIPVPMGGGLAESFLDDLVMRSDIAAMEVYARSGMVPAEYMSATGCGAVAIWTSRRFEGVAPRDPRGR